MYAQEKRKNRQYYKKEIISENMKSDRPVLLTSYCTKQYTLTYKTKTKNIFMYTVTNLNYNGNSNFTAVQIVLPRNCHMDN